MDDNNCVQDRQRYSLKEPDNRTAILGAMFASATIAEYGNLLSEDQIHDFRGLFLILSSIYQSVNKSNPVEDMALDLPSPMVFTMDDLIRTRAIFEFRYATLKNEQHLKALAFVAGRLTSDLIAAWKSVLDMPDSLTGINDVVITHDG